MWIHFLWAVNRTLRTFWFFWIIIWVLYMRNRSSKRCKWVDGTALFVTLHFFLCLKIVCYALILITYVRGTCTTNYDSLTLLKIILRLLVCWLILLCISRFFQCDFTLALLFDFCPALDAWSCRWCRCLVNWWCWWSYHSNWGVLIFFIWWLTFNGIRPRVRNFI